MNSNVKLALAMAVPAVGMFAGAMMLRGPGGQLGAGKTRIRKRRYTEKRRREVLRKLMSRRDSLAIDKVMRHVYRAQVRSGARLKMPHQAALNPELGVAGQPIRIEKVPGGYHVYVYETPFVWDANKHLSMKVRQAFRHPATPYRGKPPALLTTADQAVQAAHHAGRYLLHLGDLVYSYTELVNVPGDHEAWWNRVK
jgi:hypothetical protein